MQEAEFGRIGWLKLCPLLWSLLGSFLTVMPRADVCSHEIVPTEEMHE